MRVGRIASLIGVAMLVMATNIAVSILYMVLYGHFIDPGHESKYYQDHIEVAAPYCSIVAGIPLMFIAGWWVAGWWQQEYGVKSSLAVGLAYAIIDLTILIAVGITLRVGVLFAISFASKLAAVWYGASTRVRKTTITDIGIKH